MGPVYRPVGVGPRHFPENYNNLFALLHATPRASGANSSSARNVDDLSTYPHPQFWWIGHLLFGALLGKTAGGDGVLLSVTISAYGRSLWQVLSAVSEAGQFEVAIRLVQQMRAAGDVPSKVSRPSVKSQIRSDPKKKVKVVTGEPTT